MLEIVSHEQNCQQSELLYLGHVAYSQGVNTDPDMLTAVRTWPTPTNIKEVQQLLASLILSSFHPGFSIHKYITMCVHKMYNLYIPTHAHIYYYINTYTHIHIN